jgi:hypothetical protein
MESLDDYRALESKLMAELDDPLYGAAPPAHREFLFLGRVQLYGERGVLAVPAGDFVRLRYNPFFPYLQSRLEEFLTSLER